MHNSLELQLVCCLLFVLCASLNLNLYSGEESIIKKTNRAPALEKYEQFWNRI